jgi:hypothetical protein
MSRERFIPVPPHDEDEVYRGRVDHRSVVSIAVGAVIVVALLFAAAARSRADEALVRVPSACIALASRFDIPLQLTREQAAAALIAVNTLQSDDRDVRRCRAAIKTGEKR